MSKKRRRSKKDYSNRLISQNEPLRQVQFDDEYNDYITPPCQAVEMIRFVENSDILPTLIDAFATNVALFGHGIRYRSDFDFNKADEQTKKEATTEWKKLEYIYKYFNPKMDLKEILYKLELDKETIGYGCIEMLRDMEDNICGGEYIRACTVRIVAQKSEDRFVNVIQRRIDVDGAEEEIESPVMFKKFVQINSGNNNSKPYYIFFKEFGDKRVMDWRSGEYLSEAEAEQLSPEFRAHELLYINNHCTYSDYGMPKWWGNTPNVMGNRKSSELNLKFFEQGKIIPFAILVNGGYLSDSSIDSLKSGKGIENAYNALVLEGVPPADVSTINEKEDKVEVKIQSLTDTAQKDALFIEYQKDNRAKVRADFRLPPIYIGESSDYTRATAEVSRLITEEQVFVPERDRLSGAINTILNNEIGIKHCELYLKGPQLGDISELAQSLDPFIKAGTVTPNMLIDVLGKLLNKDVEELPTEWGDTPIEILKLHMQQSSQDSKTSTESIEKADLLAGLDIIINRLESFNGGVGDGL